MKQVEVIIAKNQSLKIVLEGAEGFALESSYSQVLEVVLSAAIRKAAGAYAQQLCNEVSGQDYASEQRG